MLDCSFHFIVNFHKVELAVSRNSSFENINVNAIEAPNTNP